MTIFRERIAHEVGVCGFVDLRCERTEERRNSHAGPVDERSPGFFPAPGTERPIDIGCETRHKENL